MQSQRNVKLSSPQRTPRRASVPALGLTGGNLPTRLRWLDMRAAREKVRVARALLLFPLISDAMGRGALSYSKVRAITRIALPGALSNDR